MRLPGPPRQRQPPRAGRLPGKPRGRASIPNVVRLARLGIGADPKQEVY